MENPVKVASETPVNLQTCRQKTSAGLASANTADGLLPARVDLISDNFRWSILPQRQRMLRRHMVYQPWKLYLCFLAYLLLMDMAPVATGAPTAVIQHNQQGRVTTCLIATCRKGYETVPCTTDGSPDTCRLCPPDKYQPVDNITSDQHLSCFRVYCAPDSQRLVHRGEPGPGNPPICECDTSKNYYQRSSLKEDCERRICDRLEHLMLNGSCICKKGRVRNENGRCVWPESETMSHAAAPTTSGHLPQGTQSQVTQSPNQTSIRSTGANDVLVAVSTLSPTAASTTSPTTATTTGTSNLAGKSGYVWLILVVVAVVALVALVIAVLYKVVEWRRRRHVRGIPLHGESHRLTSEEDSTGTSSTSSETTEKGKKTPPRVTTFNFNYNTQNFVGNKSVQYGDHNMMVQQGAAEDEEEQ